MNKEITWIGKKIQGRSVCIMRMYEAMFKLGLTKKEVSTIINAGRYFIIKNQLVFIDTPNRK